MSADWAVVLLLAGASAGFFGMQRALIMARDSLRRDLILVDQGLKWCAALMTLAAVLDAAGFIVWMAS